MKLIIYALLASLTVIKGAKILGIFSLCAYSHHSLGFRLMKELADRGHEVAYITCYPQKKTLKNFRDVSVEDSLSVVNDGKKELYELETMTYWAQLEWVLQFGVTYTELTLKNKNVQKLLNDPNEKFDLVIFEHFMNEAFAIFAHRFKCPTVIFAPGPTNEFNNHFLANPAPPSYVPSLLADFGTEMNFWERFRNTYYDIVGQLFVHFSIIPTQDALLKRTVPGAPDLETILYNASLMLLDSHISLNDPVPLQPNIKEVGGYHVQTPKPLPKDIQEYLDSAKEGVVLFSMGSNLKSADFPENKKRAILKAFSKIKQKVLWKFEEDLPGKPSNVKIMKWIPQNDILAHPNVVAFIGHGGLLGTTEAVYHGVPILGLPVFWDQVKNVEDCARKGFAVKLAFRDLTNDSFEKALSEILDNPKYRQNIKIRSEIMHDQPIKQMDEAIFWIEYVIRHKGAPHLRSAAMDLKWYQRYLIDIYLLVSAVITVVLLLLYIVIKNIFSGKKPNVAKSKKNK